MGIGVPKDLSECRSFFLEPATSKQRMYEALRAYFVEGRPSSEVAQDFGYSAGSFQVLCHHFRRDPNPIFFVSTRPGPRSQPKKRLPEISSYGCANRFTRSMKSARRSKNRSVRSVPPPYEKSSKPRDSLHFHDV